MTANGSRRWFQYTDNLSLGWAVELDESTYETNDLGFAQIATGATGPAAQGRVLQVTSQRPLSMRGVRCRRVDGNGDTFTKTFYCGTQAAQTAIFNAASVTVDGLVWSVTGTQGETRVAVPALDTGNTDGDTDSNIVNL